MPGWHSSLVAAPAPLQARETIAFDEADPPFMFVADGKPAGLYPMLVAEAAQRAGIEVELASMPWKRALAEIDAGKAGIAGIYRNGERLKKYDFSATSCSTSSGAGLRAGRQGLCLYRSRQPARQDYWHHPRLEIAAKATILRRR